MQMKTKKTWTEKLNDPKDLPKKITINAKSNKMNWPHGTYILPSPAEVDQLMKKVPKGKLTTNDCIRKTLAAKHHTDYACPMVTGIFTWIASHAAQEQADAGKKRITPYWRTLKSEGVINDKYPAGALAQRKLLLQERHSVMRKGKKYLVADYQKKLCKIK